MAQESLTNKNWNLLVPSTMALHLFASSTFSSGKVVHSHWRVRQWHKKAAKYSNCIVKLLLQQLVLLCSLTMISTGPEGTASKATPSPTTGSTPFVTTDLSVRIYSLRATQGTYDYTEQNTDSVICWCGPTSYCVIKHSRLPIYVFVHSTHVFCISPH